jgi:hypothetical protein
MTAVDTVWVVLDGHNRVVLICEGADAPEVAAEWRGRGFRVRRLDSPDVHAA